MIRECIVIHSLRQGFLLTSVISFGRDGDVWCSVFFGQCFQRSSIPSKWAKILAHPFKTSMCLSLRSSDLVSFRVSFLDVHVWIFTIVYKRVELYLYVCVLIQKDTQDTTRFHFGFRHVDVTPVSNFCKSSTSFPSSCVALTCTSEAHGRAPRGLALCGGRELM